MRRMAGPTGIDRRVLTMPGKTLAKTSQRPRNGRHGRALSRDPRPSRVGNAKAAGKFTTGGYIVVGRARPCRGCIDGAGGEWRVSRKHPCSCNSSWRGAHHRAQRRCHRRQRASVDSVCRCVLFVRAIVCDAGRAWWVLRMRLPVRRSMPAFAMSRRSRLSLRAVAPARAGMRCGDDARRARTDGARRPRQDVARQAVGHVAGHVVGPAQARALSPRAGRFAVAAAIAGRGHPAAARQCAAVVQVGREALRPAAAAGA